MAEYNGHEDEGASSSSSRLQITTPSKRAKRLEQRKSYSYSPYPKGSPRTPARRAVGEASLLHSPRSQASNTPQSPGMRAITSIIGLLTPFGSRQARSSAAFGEPDLSVHEGVDGEEDVQQQEGEQSQFAETIDDSMDQSKDEPEQRSIYPALPSEHKFQPVFAPAASQGKEATVQQKARQSLFNSAPSHSTPFRSSVGGLASSATQQINPPSASTFTFGNLHGAGSSASPLPSYPRTAPRVSLTSPLAKNYDLLARFFAEKAEQSARDDDAPSAASLADGQAGGEEGGLTEIEVAGCMRLIEESLVQGRAGELERLQGDALERASLRVGTPRYVEETPYTRRYISRSPSLPLGAAAGDMSGTYGARPRPSSSFLSPLFQSDDARINRSLANTFGSNSVPAKRRHRPLYLGPGQGAGATSSLLRRNQQLQQQRKTLASRSQQTSRSPIKPSWHRGEVDQEDREASGSNAKRQRLEVREEVVSMISAQQQARSLSSSQSLPAFSNITPTSFASPPTPEPSVPDEDEPVLAPPPRTATADAMLSILSAGPSIPARPTPSRRGVPAKAVMVVESEEDQEQAATLPEIVNPYQTRSRLTKRSSAAPGASMLAAKEKERLKEEREKRQRLSQEEKAKAKESTLKVPEVTEASAQISKRDSRRNKPSEDEQKSRDQEAKKKEATAAEEQKKKAEVEEADRNKKAEAEEAEEKQRIEAEEAERRREKERERKTELVKKKMEKLANQSAMPDSSSTPSSSEAPATTPTVSNVPRKSIAFGSSFAPKKPSPLSQADNMTPDSPSSSSDDGLKPFSFLSTASSIGQPIQELAAKVTTGPSFDSSKVTPREQALAATTTSLPKFDFFVDFINSSTEPSSGDTSRAAAKEKATALLPVFELLDYSKGDDISGKPSIHDLAASSFATPASAPASEVSKESTVEVSASEAESETKSGEGSVSALLSGKGEGEENEDCLHEVRSKVWKLKEGKWADLGIGLFKIKKNHSDGKKRVLVRNEGNGKVMVNFRLVESFKPIKDKNVVSFLGFDGEGKPANYRCKVKTDDNANELAGALQREAVS